MTDSRQPTAGSLSAKIIRACARHTGKCPLDCKYRTVEDLGEIATFSTPTGDQPPVKGWLERIFHRGGSP